MPEGSNVEQARAFAREEVQRLLGLDEPDTGELFALAEAVLGAGRAQRCLQLARAVPLTQREQATAHVAVLVLGTRELRERWWRRAGDALLAGGGDGVLARAATAITDACADARWGPPVAVVDLDDPRVDDRVALPAGLHPGDALLAAWDPGCRVVVEVVQRDGVTGSVLGEQLWHETAELRWAWSVAIDAGPVRLPGEVAGCDSDPFAALVDAVAARRLRAWAGEREPDGEQLGGAWITRADLWEAHHRLGLHARGVDWDPFDIVARAAVDGDAEQLAYALARLDMS